MFQPDHSIDILTGGFYSGNSSWNKNRTEIDNCYKLYYLTQGELYLTDNEREYLLQKDTFYFINGDKLASQFCHNSFSTHWLHFLPKDLIIHHGLLTTSFVVDIPVGELTFSESVKQIETVLTGRCNSSQTLYLESTRIHILLQSVIAYLLKRFPWDYTPDNSVRQIEPAIHYIKEHYTEPIRLSHLADCCHISSNYFHKLFTRTLHITPGNYINRHRLNASLPLLFDEKYNIKEIAFQLGFCNDAYFSRVFRKYYGMTPGEYKRKRDNLFF